MNFRKNQKIRIYIYKINYIHIIHLGIKNSILFFDEI